MNKKEIVYLDNAASTKVYREVVGAMNEAYLKEYGNPGSPHEFGERARKKMDEARKYLAIEIGAKAYEIVFTSGATEANNLAFFGVANSNKDKKKNKIVISAIEHASVYETAMELKKKGYEIVEVNADEEGLLDLDNLKKEADERTLLVSIIHGNNEIGVLQNLKKIGEICKEKKIVFHTDAVQSFGKERINVREMNIDLLSASAHKIGGPKGIGFLYVKEGLELKPLIYGGGQEAGRRGGTENVPGIIGFAKALEMLKKVDKEKIRKLRDYLMEELEKIGGKINGSKEKRLFNSVHVSFNKDAEMLVIKLSQKGIMLSSRSACAEKQERSENRILRAIGLKDKEIRGSLRLVLNENITKKDIDYVINIIKRLMLS